MPASDLDWNELFVRYEAMAVAFVRGLGADPALARDLYQEAARATFERASSGGVQFEGPQHIRNYLFQTLRNLACDAHTAKKRAPAELKSEPVDPAANPVEQLAATEAKAVAARRLVAAFATLPAREQEALTRRYLRGQSYQQIATATGKSISTLQARVAAGLARLRLAFGISGRHQ